MANSGDFNCPIKYKSQNKLLDRQAVKICMSACKDETSFVRRKAVWVILPPPYAFKEAVWQ